VKAAAAKAAKSVVKTAAIKSGSCGREPAAVEPAGSAATEAAASDMKPAAAMEPAAAAMEPAAAAMETSAPLMGIGRMWLAERTNAQQSHGRGCQGLAHPEPGAMFA
jgi:hypothetical protein